MPFGVDVRLSDLYPEMYPAAEGYITSQPLDASDPEHLKYTFEVAGAGCTVIITNTPHNTDEACAIVRTLISLVEGQHVDFVAALFRAIWGAEPGRLPFFNLPSFYGEILCCWRPRWIPGSEGSPMHAYAWYIWRKEPRSGPSSRRGQRRTRQRAADGGDETLSRSQVSQSAYIALMRSTTAASTWMKPLAPIALHRPPCRAVGQRRGDRVIGHIPAER
jgi:hypothetical protein